MTIIQMEATKVVESYFYDPDGANAPLTLRFPLSTDPNVLNGARIRIINKTQSPTPVTLQAQGSDTVSDVANPSVFAASQQLTRPEILYQFQLAGTQWRLISHGDPDLAALVLQIFSFASYAKMELSTPLALPGDIGATWDTVDVFDLQPYTPQGITVNLTNSSFTFLYDGIYSLSILLNYVHNEAQQSRQTQLRIYNLTDGTGAKAITIPIARNQDATLIALTTSFEVVDADKNKEFVLQIGNGDVVSVTSIEAASWETHAISEWREPLTGFTG